MRTISTKIIDMTIQPDSQAARKFITPDARFEIMMADHAYQRNMQRFEEVFKKYSRFAESQYSFIERSACEVRAKILNMEAQPNEFGIVNMIRNNFIWVFDMKRGIPAFVTLYPFDKEWKSQRRQVG